jgi:hypothetical protein
MQPFLAAILTLMAGLHVAMGSLPAPVLKNYTIANSRDTFDICKELSGLGRREIPLEDLLPVFNLPSDLPKYQFINLAKFIRLMQQVQPDVQIVFAPMLFGEADLSGVLSQGLPKLVHFTVKDKNKLKPHQVVSMASWAKHNPGHSIMLFDDSDIHLFMTTYFPELLSTFDGLDSQVERTDMWRYLVLCIFGGVYADSDVVSARPLSDWVQDAGLLTGIENVFTSFEEAKRRTYTRQVQMVQWAIAAKRGHPVVCRMGEYVKHHVAKEQSGEFFDPDRNHAILERTGPGIWSSSVHDYIMEHGYNITDVVAGMKVGDVRILPQPAFGCASSTFNPEHDPVPYVYHMFKGSWRKAPPSKVLHFLENVYRWLAGLEDLDSMLQGWGPHDDVGAADQDSGVADVAGAAPGSSSSSRSGNHLLESRKLRAVGRNRAVQGRRADGELDLESAELLPLGLMVALLLLMLLTVVVALRVLVYLIVWYCTTSPLVARLVILGRQKLLQGFLLSQTTLRAAGLRVGSGLRPMLRRYGTWLAPLRSSCGSLAGYLPLPRLQSGPSGDSLADVDCSVSGQKLTDVGRLKRVGSSSTMLYRQ